MSLHTCPNGCDLTYPDPYGSDAHYSRMIGIEVRGVYDCGLTWPRPGFEPLFSQVQW